MIDLIYSPKPKNVNWGTGCIVLNSNNQVLLGLRSDNKLWGSPGGTVEDGETPYDAILRETLEESGLTIKFPECLSIAYSFDERDYQVWNSFVFVCRDYTGTVTRQVSEVDEYKWVDLWDLYTYDLFRPFIQSMEVYNEYFGTSYLIQKMTSMEQLTSIHNPGTNGGSGHYDTNGKWVYDKETDKKVAPTKTTNNSSTSSNANQIQLLRNSYMQYFKQIKDTKKLYTVVNGKFVFPKVDQALKDGLIKSKDDYLRLFKEQYIIFAVSNKSS